MSRILVTLVVLLPLAWCGRWSAAQQRQAAQVDQAAEALRRAVDYFRGQVSTEGGYLWQYSEDLKRREGENRADAQTVWVQPPGTPAVGMALLEVYQATGDRRYLDAARDAGYCLVRGQLQSGGWDYRIHFDEGERRRYAYRVDKAPIRDKTRNVTTLDDNTTQAALRLLMRLDQTLEFQDERIHEAVDYALASLAKAQYPNGAWPQRYDSFPDPDEYPVKQASYPESWPQEWPGKNYRTFYTFNDNALADTMDVMFMAARIYDEPRYRQIGARGGDFMLLAQMPEPQPAWAQQYDRDMHPAWARKFEPPAVTGGESYGVMQALIQVYRETGDEKYIEPLPRAINYLRRSARADGRLARFYELQTNKPLYFTKDYQLTYSDADMPTHYAFIVSNRVDRVESELQRVRETPKDRLAPRASRRTPRLTRSLAQSARRVIEQLDKQGRWVEEGGLSSVDDDSVTRIISCRTFIRNIEILGEYLAAAKAAE